MQDDMNADIGNSFEIKVVQISSLKSRALYCSVL